MDGDLHAALGPLYHFLQVSLFLRLLDRTASLEPRLGDFLQSLLRLLSLACSCRSLIAFVYNVESEPRPDKQQKRQRLDDLKRLLT
jgi:hypothetical protein